MNDETSQSDPLEQHVIEVIIPICCREGHDDCPHVINRPEKPAKKNIGV